MRQAIFLFILVLVSADAAFAQFEQMRRSRIRMQESVRANEELERQRRELEKASILPTPKAAVMNVDVQAVVSKKDVATFAEASAAAAHRVTDGEPLWMHIKFKSKLGDYVLTVRDEKSPEKLRYYLYAEMGPQGDSTALNQYVLEFFKEDLEAREIKFNLAPGAFGRNKAMPVYLMTSAAGNPGVWNNEIRITNTKVVPRGPTENLTKTDITVDLAGGVGKYRQMERDYDSMVLRGTTDVGKLPEPGSFFDEELRNKIIARLAAEKIVPVRLYFSGDTWAEYVAGVMGKRTRKVYASFTYKTGGQCGYGLAKVTETYDAMASKWSEPDIELAKEIAIPCTRVE